MSQVHRASALCHEKVVDRIVILVVSLKANRSRVELESNKKYGYSGIPEPNRTTQLQLIKEIEVLSKCIYKQRRIKILILWNVASTKGTTASAKGVQRSFKLGYLKRALAISFEAWDSPLSCIFLFLGHNAQQEQQPTHQEELCKFT